MFNFFVLQIQGAPFPLPSHYNVLLQPDGQLNINFLCQTLVFYTLIMTLWKTDQRVSKLGNEVGADVNGFSQVCNFANPACLNQPRQRQRSRGRGSRGRGGKKEKVKEVWSQVKKLWHGGRKHRQRQPRHTRSFSSRGLWKSVGEKIQNFKRKARMITSLWFFPLSCRVVW